LLALPPTSLFQAASLSADAGANALSILLIALFLRRAFGADGGRPGLPPLLCLSALVAVSKLSFPLVLVFFLIPRERFGDPARYRRSLLALLGCAALALLVWGLYARGLYIPLRRLPPVSPLDQLRHVLLEPLAYAGVLWRTVTLKTPHYLLTFVGQLGHFPLRLPAAAVALHLLALTLVSALDEDAGIRLSPRDRLKLAAIAGISSLWIVTTQYLSWTEVGAGLIEGVYGRYFIPIAPLIFLPFQGLAASRGRRFPALPSAVAAYAVLLLAYAAHALTAYWGS
jgi:uncharacterized membrane protein